MQSHNPLIVALDRSSRDEILTLADTLAGAVGLFKVGMQAFIANGPALVQELSSRGTGVFLDLKLHDIPNTVSNAVAEARALGAELVTVHAGGGRAMMGAAAAQRSHAGTPRLLAVTMLTSLTDVDMHEIGFHHPMDAQVRQMAVVARESGLDGVVASPHEISLIRDACGPSFLIVTPGIRAEKEARGDQARTMSASEAIRAGADYIVVGRPITESPDPRGSVLRILDSIGRTS